MIVDILPEGRGMIVHTPQLALRRQHNEARRTALQQLKDGGNVLSPGKLIGGDKAAAGRIIELEIKREDRLIEKEIGGLRVLREPLKLLKLKHVIERNSTDRKDQRGMPLDLPIEWQQGKSGGDDPQHIANESRHRTTTADKPHTDENRRWSNRAETEIAGSAGNREKERNAYEMQKNQVLAKLNR